MASGSKESSVFTSNPMGGTPGKTPSQKKSTPAEVGGGGSILTAYPQDNVHGLDLPNTMGDSMGGSCTNLSHSLRGASAVQRGSGGGGKTEKSGI
jgi:hypothetical protein